MSDDEIVPASPSTPSLRSEEALLLHTALRADLKAHEKRLLSAQDDFAQRLYAAQEEAARGTMNAFQRAYEWHATSERKHEVTRLQQAEWNRRNEERLTHIVRALSRQEDILTRIYQRADRTEVERAIPWFLRPDTWRPVVVALALSIIAGSFSACATVRMLTPEASVDAGKHP
jgi:hypothetical protein